MENHTAFTYAQAKALLEEMRLPFVEEKYADISEFYDRIRPFPGGTLGKTGEALIIKSNNGVADFVVLFADGVMDDVYFGSYAFDLWGEPEEWLSEDLVQDIRETMAGNWIFGTKWDLSRKRWVSDVSWDRLEDWKRYEKAAARIQRASGLISRIFGRETVFEIFDWDHYQSVQKKCL